jgi:hypothetical protein
LLLLVMIMVMVMTMIAADVFFFHLGMFFKIENAQCSLDQRFMVDPAFLDKHCQSNLGQFDLYQY